MDIKQCLRAREDMMSDVAVAPGKAKRLFDVCLWVFKRGGPNEVVIHSYPKAVFTWPLWVLGILLAFFSVDGSITVGWIYLITLMVVLLTLCFDVNRNLAFFWLVLIAGVFFTAMWLRDVKGLLLVNSFGSWVSHWDPVYSKSFGLGVSWVLTLIYVVVFFQTRLSNRWRFTRNEVEKISLGHRDDSIGRGAKRVRSSYPDVFELVILGAGMIEIYPAGSKGGEPLARIEHIPFLPLRMKKIGPLLEALSVAPGGEQDEALEHEGDDGDEVLH